MINTITSAAQEAEASGNLADAATAYFVLGAYKMADEMFQNGRYYREGITDVLRSISIDVRIGNTGRAEQTAAFLKDGNSILIDNRNEAVVRGLGYEWRGDASLMLGGQGAKREYQKSRKCFEELDFETQLHWGAVPEYDTGFIAMKQYLESLNINYYKKHDIDFTGRVRWKIELSKEILG